MHWDHAELQAAQRGAPVRIAAALQRRWSRSVGLRVRGGAEPQSPARLLPQRSEPDQREAAGKICTRSTHADTRRTFNSGELSSFIKTVTVFSSLSPLFLKNKTFSYAVKNKIKTILFIVYEAR